MVINGNTQKNSIQKKEKEKKTGQTENKELDGRLNPTILIITLKVYCPIIPIKRQKLLD